MPDPRDAGLADCRGTCRRAGPGRATPLAGGGSGQSRPGSAAPGSRESRRVNIPPPGPSHRPPPPAISAEEGAVLAEAPAAGSERGAGGREGGAER